MKHRAIIRSVIAVLAGIAMCAPITATAQADDKGPADNSTNDQGTIETAGPLKKIVIGKDLKCSVWHKDDAASEFFGNTACGTFVAVDGTLYGPKDIPAFRGDSSKVNEYKQVSQTHSKSDDLGVSTIKTTVNLGDSGVQLTQTDQYASGYSYSTDLELQNNSGKPIDVKVYRAGDCYLQNNDTGTGLQGEGWVACGGRESQRTIRWADTTKNSGLASPERFWGEDYFGTIWQKITNLEDFFPRSVNPDKVDNGAALEWTGKLAAGRKATLTSTLSFAAGEDYMDTDGDGIPDLYETATQEEATKLNIPYLKGMGADPEVPDVFVEADYMAKDAKKIFGWTLVPLQDTHLTDDAIKKIVTAFSKRGIRLHIDAGSKSIMPTWPKAHSAANPSFNPKNTWGNQSEATTVDWMETIESSKEDDNGAAIWQQIDSIKKFDSKRASIFHYAIIGNKLMQWKQYFVKPSYEDHYTCQTGLSRSAAKDVKPANHNGGQYFFVSATCPGISSKTGDVLMLDSPDKAAGTFMHELGHNLGLGHGGQDDVNFKPNYISIMNYSFQLAGLPTEANKHIIDYSTLNLGTLNEHSLNENSG